MFQIAYSLYFHLGQSDQASLRYESERNPNYQADTESAGSTDSINPSNNQSPTKLPGKIQKKVKVRGI